MTPNQTPSSATPITYASAGVDVVRVGVVPTPAAAFLVNHLDADLGVMLSASHNPIQTCRTTQKVVHPLQYQHRYQV